MLAPKALRLKRKLLVAATSAHLYQACNGIAAASQHPLRRDPMFKNLLVRRAVRHALVANALVMACATVQAAQEPIAEIVVTGSRIARPDIEASTPVQVLSGQAIDMQGSPNVSDILAELPAVGTPG